ncbi:MAG TPA: lysylphosphatidylglycerol synthase transmembrane domain-containing protein [bacterium]|nr:lysylphosphatidylglycerol synthase transmembrane domain-containing protein [bacterium]HMW32498.1 lysylphosphatidylglycerol synthase transmembrane domain-containing protein [bacterium]HMW35201.1 lysylphosphatidylglycerol synthase transmembrane domain-containing protein [bacterium]HMY35041.1 lysylphosphatidylglycerol synthase transmembrane domain-containing protein [bacterium]HMZ04374.1 lysylphosphatidylglycerol synthase transmembrane domain-containing protein [bacterium]
MPVTWQKYVWTVLKISVSLGLMYWAVRSIDLTVMIAIWQSINVNWILASFILLTLSYLLGAWQWQSILAIGDIRLKYPTVVGYYYVGLFFNNFLISGMGGDVLRVYDIHRHTSDPQRLSPALAVVFFDRFVGLLILILYACISGIFLIGQGESLRMFFAITGLLLLWIFALILLFHRPLAIFLLTPLAWLVPKRLRMRVDHLYSELNRFRTAPQLLMRVFLIAGGVQMLRIIAIAAIGRALGDASSLMFYILFVPMISLAASLPISIGGTGPREQTTVFLFRKIGVSSEIAFSIGFVTYLLSAVSTLPGGFIFMLRKNKAEHAVVS